MFQRQKKKLKFEIPVETVNDYNETITTYTQAADIEIAVSADTKSFYINNDVDFLNVGYLGITEDKRVEKGCRIDGRFLVEYVEDFGRLLGVHLKEVNNNGYINR